MKLRIKPIIYTNNYNIFKDKKFLYLKRKNKWTRNTKSINNKKLKNKYEINLEKSNTLNLNPVNKYNNNECSLNSFNSKYKKQYSFKNILKTFKKISIKKKQFLKYIDNIFVKNTKYVVKLIKNNNIYKLIEYLKSDKNLKLFQKIKMEILIKENKNYLIFLKNSYYKFNKSNIEKYLLKLWFFANKFVIPINKLNKILKKITNEILKIKNYRLVSYILLYISDIYFNNYMSFKSFDLLVKLFQLIFIIDDNLWICLILDKLITFEFRSKNDYETSYYLILILLVISWKIKNFNFESKSYYYLSIYFYYNGNLKYSNIFQSLERDLYTLDDKKLYYIKVLYNKWDSFKFYNSNYVSIKEFYNTFENNFKFYSNEEIKYNFLYIKLKSFINSIKVEFDSLINNIVDNYIISNKLSSYKIDISAKHKIFLTHKNFNSNPFSIFNCYDINNINDNNIYITEKQNIINIKDASKKILLIIKLIY